MIPMHHWFATNGLKINPGKTQLMNFHLNHHLSHQSNTSYLPSQLILDSSINFLGVEIDSCFVWQPHIAKLLPKPRVNALYAVRTLLGVTGFQTLLQIYFAYFQSHISYGTTSWGNSSNAINVFQMQKKVI